MEQASDSAIVLGHCEGALIARVDFKNAHGPVPQDGLRIFNFVAKELDALGANVDTLPAVLDIAFKELTLSDCAGTKVEVFYAEVIEREEELDALLLSLG
jgi:hypothetical protein